ncbi:MAG: two-component system response regulator [Gammaproteobacteria bacterium]|nr:MAG: two-component system response regulator [Gammaproteobacteria bacterium]RKZ42797.1 MAG: two-component system response regulator [Gammaproteobacteria bacterium]RKZ77343.1 MAG: two-component system response regulator [Gammaproteobacteria bacterium]
MSINKIMAVDDSKVDLINIQNILSDAGYNVITASSGHEAIDKASVEKPDLIFMDVVMQKMDGYQACRELTHQDSTKDIPIVFVTAKGQKADRVWAEMTGAKGLVQKPYTPDQIIEQVNQFN